MLVSALVITLIILVGAYFSYKVARKVYRTYKTFTTRCDNLQQQIYMLGTKLERYTDYYKYDNVKYEDNAFNYLAIGKSLTLIDSENRGICASHEDRDYYSLVVKELKNKHNKVYSYRHNFAIWEQGGNPHECLQFFDYALSEKLNLITIQLSENIKNIDTFEKDLTELIEYIKVKAPNAELIIVGDFWSKDKSEIKERVANHENIKFASLNDIIGNKKYQAPVGYECFHPDGTSHRFTSTDGAGHPNDEGFRFIADKIIECCIN